MQPFALLMFLVLYYAMHGGQNTLIMEQTGCTNNAVFFYIKTKGNNHLLFLFYLYSFHQNLEAGY